MLYMMLNKEEEIKKDLKSMMLGLENLENGRNHRQSFQRIFFWLICVRISLVRGYLEFTNCRRLFKTPTWKRKRAWRLCDRCLSKQWNKREDRWTLYLPEAIFKSFQLLRSKLYFKVKEKHVNRGAGFGLEIPVKYTLYEHKKAPS